MSRGLCAALAPVVTGAPGELALNAARNVAQLLALPGLDRLLAAIEANLGATGSSEMRHTLERLGRERDRALAESTLHHFFEVDDELAALASHLEGVEWSAPAAANAVDDAPAARRDAVIGLASTLGSGRYADEASEATAAKSRLTAPVAAVLRAALDWLFGDAAQRAPLRVSADAGVVELECRGIDAEGLLPAHEVIAGVGGALFPAPAGARDAWVLRLPAVTERDVFLMLLQDDLRLALPWTNVLRIQLETAAAAPLTAPPLAPLKPLTGARQGRPVVTVGLGLRRGALAADRLVWRLPAEPAESASETPAGATHAVRADDGEIFWVIDVSKLMRDVPLPAAAAVGAVATDDMAAGRAATPSATDVSGKAEAPPRLALLTPDSVEPLAGPAAPGNTLDSAPAPAAPARDAQPATGTRAAAAAPERPQAPDAPAGGTDARGKPSRAAFPGAHRLGAGAAPAAAGPVHAAADGPGHGMRALIAEDSFMARIFLMRLLQTHGYNVHSVGTAAELRAALSGEAWSLVCVDVDLPDARGPALVREVAESQTDRPEPAVVVVLVRDWRDREQAEAGGIHRTLLKPFSQAGVAAMLEHAGLPARGSR